MNSKNLYNKRSSLPTLVHEEKPNENDINVKAYILGVFVTLFPNGNYECVFCWRLKHLKFSKIQREITHDSSLA